MILKRVYDDNLAQASYLIGCKQTGEALVVDPNRDADQYIALAQAERVRITHVTETHIHADFVSGTRELAARTGATMYLSGEGGPDWQYGFAQAPNARIIRDGDEFQVGNIRVRVAHTPGHTPEHVIFFITDGAAADKPIAVVTGDFVFVGDVGRPDLLEKAAQVKGTMEGAARQLFRSLQTFKLLPDYLQIWPGHGAGSACGKGLSAIPHSTVGYERMFNWAFAYDSEDEFVTAVLSGQPEPPKYFAQMKRINRDGPRVLGGFPNAPELSFEQFTQVLRAHATVVDTRRISEFAARHVPGTINIPLDRSFSTWAGWLLPYDRDFYLTGSPDTMSEATKALALIGLDHLAGYFPTAVIDDWAARGNTLQAVPQINSNELARKMERGEVHVLDVRGRSEWDAGHVPDVPNIPLGHLTDRLSELPSDWPLVVHCQSGTRSSIAASVLQAHGVTNVINLTGGFADWARSGHAVERSQLPVSTGVA
jgi:hydroxyacylglutathione hydrolase